MEVFMSNPIFDDFDVVYSYTRKDTIEDGVLVDVSSTAKEAGINFPVALTSTVWDLYVVPSDSLEDSGQSTAGRLWDLLWMFRNYALRSNSSLMHFNCLFLNSNRHLEEVRFKALCGPGDNHEPVITIMMPWED